MGVVLRNDVGRSRDRTAAAAGVWSRGASGYPSPHVPETKPRNSCWGIWSHWQKPTSTDIAAVVDADADAAAAAAAVPADGNRAGDVAAVVVVVVVADVWTYLWAFSLIFCDPKSQNILWPLVNRD